MRLCFFHGLDSSPQGSKARLLRRYDPECWIPALPKDIYKRVEIVRHEAKAPMIVVGSSLGGLTAVMYAMGYPQKVKGLVLMAPAFGSRDRRVLAEEEQGLLESLYIPEGIPTVVIAGIRDELIPVSAIRTVIERSPEPSQIHLYEVDDDHNLHQHLDLMLESIAYIRKQVSKEGISE